MIRHVRAREAVGGGGDKAAQWLAVNVCEKERQVDRVREQLLAHLRDERLEPPTRDRVRRIIGTALRQAEQTQTVRISGRIPAEALARMLALIARTTDPGDEQAAAEDDGGLFDAAEVAAVDVFAAIRDEPGLRKREDDRARGVQAQRHPRDQSARRPVRRRRAEGPRGLAGPG